MNSLNCVTADTSSTKKQAPVNFIKDNGYHYFEIVTDGEMVEVENKAGVGFINDHMVGNLKIVKTSLGRPCGRLQLPYHG